MNEREARRQSRLRQKIYHPSLASLRQRHHKLFDPRGSQSLIVRNLGHKSSGFLLAESTLRVVARDKRLKQLCTQRFATFLAEFGATESNPVEVFVTANVILSKVGEDGRESYSVFYGQSYHHNADSKAADEDSARGENPSVPEPSSEQELTQLCERFSCSTVSEFQKKFPRDFDVARVADRFAAALGDTSDVAVHSVINYVCVYLCLVPKDEGAFAEVTTGIPRVEEAG